MTIDRTFAEVEDLMKSLARLLLEVPDTDNNSVRIPYGASSATGSAPAHTPTKSVCYVYVNPTDDGYGQQHHITYKDGANGDDDLTEVDDYTEEYAVIFSFYGHDAYDRARLLRDGIYGVAAKVFLWRKHIHPKTVIPPIVQTHEVVNAQWVARCDVTVTFYAHIRIERENELGSIEKVGITFKTPKKTVPYPQINSSVCGLRKEH
jgi:hypothetical protein